MTQLQPVNTIAAVTLSPGVTLNDPLPLCRVRLKQQ